MTFKSQIHAKSGHFPPYILNESDPPFSPHKTSVLEGQFPAGWNLSQVLRPRPWRIASNPPQRPESDPSIPPAWWRFKTLVDVSFPFASGVRRLSLRAIHCAENLCVASRPRLLL